MPPPVISVPIKAARRFMRRQVLLDSAVSNVAMAIQHLGFVQLDPINVCGRMHDLILRNRVAGYRENDLLACLHPPASERMALEHYLPGARILVALPIEAWPFLLPGMLSRREGPKRLKVEEEALADDVLAEIRARGPLSSDDFSHQGRGITAWGTEGRMVKILLDELFAQGRLLICKRRAFRRIYDLPERCLPGRWQSSQPATPEELLRWALELRLKQRRLVTLRRVDFPVIEDRVQEVKIEGCPPLFCLREDVPQFEPTAESVTDPKPLLLAPLDPLIYDRRVTLGVWHLDYTWEVYTPPEKRLRGYYALPVLAGENIVGHVDLKADRTNRRLVVISRKIRRGYAASSAVRELAGFLGLKG